MADYRRFQTAEELNEFYQLNLINEARKENEKKVTEPATVIQKDKLEVKYADKIEKYNNIFKHIIVFTNDKNPKDNKTLDNIYKAIENLKKDKCDIVPELHIFEAAEMTVDDDENEIVISDGDNEMTIKDESNIDTLVFSRLGVQGEDQCEHIVKLLQDRGFFVLNPIKYAALACDKYETAMLLKKGEIPQPNFCLMTKDILYDEDLYSKSMKDVYPDWDEKDPDKNKEKDVVVKILDGHGGTGVALIDGKRLYAWLQLVFAIDPERRLLIQKKEEADGGDIRVHVLTLRDKQVILAAMKRIKISNDFRSNVSLGAEAEPVKLTSEQEQIALKVARLSHLPWCAVDILPVKKGTNPELGDNAVLETNASAGSRGISDVIDENLINIILNELDDPNNFFLQEKIVGFIETINIDFGDGHSKDYLAKLDTGNSTVASTIEVGEFTEEGDNIKFKVDDKEFTFKKNGSSTVHAGEEKYVRSTIIIPEIRLGHRKLTRVPFALVKSREHKSTNVLLNRDVLMRMAYVVDSNAAHRLTHEIEKVKIL